MTPEEIHQQWQKERVFEAPEVPQDVKNKRYVLDMFPYPSAQGLHVGHPEGYTATDIYSRYLRMKGMEVMHPMGWDAFGLPAENYAIKTGVDPDTSTHNNITNFRRQIQSLGFSYDWSREVDTSSSAYYRWTQWMFLQMYKHGLAYRKKAKVNWCNTCQTVLANEQVENGMCERSKDPVVQKDLEQWFFKITDYAEQLLNDLDTLDWPEAIKLMQRNWIGKSEGAEIDFVIEGREEKITVFTTRPDTLFGVTYVVLAPEHPLVEQIVTPEQRDAVIAYQDTTRRKNDLERTELNKEKTGVFTGAYAINPANGKKVPVWIADYALITYGTGAVMAVPAHDERDWEFAQKYVLPVRRVISGGSDEACYTEGGVLMNSGEFDGASNEEAKWKITEKAGGRKVVKYRLRDWLISRQRYWGAPIPIVYDPEGNAHPIDEKYLPLKLPTDVDYRPKGTSPLGSSASYQALAEKLYGKGSHFEIDTMDTFVCSSWYYLRYCDPKNDKEFASQDKLAAWLPVDMYVGGAEHAVLHLLYARFFHKALQDFGLIPSSVGREPFKALRNQGMILGEDHQKMSKSRGNVVNPDEVVAQYGADTLRMYEMFMGPFDEVKPWDTSSIKGIYRFLEKVKKFYKEQASIQREKDATNSEMDKILNQAIQKVGEDIENFHFNTAISALMIAFTKLTKESFSWSDQWLAKYLTLLYPFAPFTAYDLATLFLWNIDTFQWPEIVGRVADDEVPIAIQINGKTKGVVSMPWDAEESEVFSKAQALSSIAKNLEGKMIIKKIFVPKRILNIVVK